MGKMNYLYVGFTQKAKCNTIYANIIQATNKYIVQI